MRLTKSLVREVTSQLIGDDVIQVTDILHNKRDVSEFVLAEKLDMDINGVRNMLYRLHNENMVTFTKKKDYTKGWYV
jgi:transcription initiation factor IIE alpha subunit